MLYPVMGSIAWRPMFTVKPLTRRSRDKTPNPAFVTTRITKCQLVFIFRKVSIRHGGCSGMQPDLYRQHIRPDVDRQKRNNEKLRAGKGKLAKTSAAETLKRILNST
jgi:hypothetical protein